MRRARACIALWIGAGRIRVRFGRSAGWSKSARLGNFGRSFARKQSRRRRRRRSGPRLARSPVADDMDWSL